MKVLRICDILTSQYFYESKIKISFLVLTIGKLSKYTEIILTSATARFIFVINKLFLFTLLKDYWHFLPLIDNRKT